MPEWFLYTWFLLCLAIGLLVSYDRLWRWQRVGVLVVRRHGLSGSRPASVRVMRRVHGPVASRCVYVAVDSRLIPIFNVELDQAGAAHAVQVLESAAEAAGP